MEKVHQQCSEYWWNQDCLIHHDNVLAHVALPVQQFWDARNKVVASPPSLLPWFGPLRFFSCFWEWNQSYQHVISRMYLKFRNKPWLFYIWRQIYSLSNVYSSGRNAGLIKQTWMGTTCKQTTATNNEGKYIFHYIFSSGTFGYALIHRDYDNSANCYISQIHIKFYSPQSASSSITLFHNHLVHLSSYKQLHFIRTLLKLIIPEKYLIGNTISHQQKQAWNDSVSNKISSNTKQHSKIAHSYPSVKYL